MNKKTITAMCVACLGTLATHAQRQGNYDLEQGLTSRHDQAAAATAHRFAKGSPPIAMKAPAGPNMKPGTATVTTPAKAGEPNQTPPADTAAKRIEAARSTGRTTRISSIAAERPAANTNASTAATRIAVITEAPGPSPGNMIMGNPAPAVTINTAVHRGTTVKSARRKDVTVPANTDVKTRRAANTTATTTTISVAGIHGNIAPASIANRPDDPRKIMIVTADVSRPIKASLDPMANPARDATTPANTNAGNGTPANMIMIIPTDHAAGRPIAAPPANTGRDATDPASTAVRPAISNIRMTRQVTKAVPGNMESPRGGMAPANMNVPPAAQVPVMIGMIRK
jgi:hypothetical protein